MGCGNAMKYYDVSMMVSKDMQVYKNKPEKKPIFKIASDFDQGSSHETQVDLNLHSGTHMDFPLHMIKDGQTSDALELSRLIRKVKVFDMTHVKDGIDKEDLEKLVIDKDDFVLFKTTNSFEDTFNFKFIYLKDSGAKYLAQKKINGVGIDALGIERDQSGHPTHKILFESDIYIIEGLRLKEVKEDEYFMYALPIKMPDADALLLSVILVE